VKPGPRPLVVLHLDPSIRNGVESYAPGHFLGRWVSDWDQLREAVIDAPPAAVAVVDPYHGQAEGSGPSPHLYDLLKAFPSATVVAALDVTPSRHGDLRDLGDWGISEILQLGEDLNPVAFLQRLASARAQHLHALLNRDEATLLSGRARSILDAAVSIVLAGGHPRDLARKLGFSPSTLLRWCERSQLPTPRRLLLWLRVLFASALLDDPGHTVFSVGKACGYSGDQALRRAIRSVLPHTPSELRELGAFDTASSAFFGELAKKHDDEAERR